MPKWIEGVHLQQTVAANSIAPTVFRSRHTAWIWNGDPIGEATRLRSPSRIPLGRLGEVEDLMLLRTERTPGGERRGEQFRIA